MKSYADILAGRSTSTAPRRAPKKKTRARERQVAVLHEVREKRRAVARAKTRTKARAKAKECGCAEKKKRPTKAARLLASTRTRGRRGYVRGKRDKHGRFLSARQHRSPVRSRSRSRKNPILGTLLANTFSTIVGGHVVNRLKESGARARANPLAVRQGYRKRAQLQRDLTRHYEECSASPSARRFKGERRKSYCAGVAWKIVHQTGRYNDYFEENPAMARKRRQSAAQRRASLRNLAKARRARRGGRRTRAREAAAPNPIRRRARRSRRRAREAAPNPIRRRRARRSRRYSREKLPGGRIRVRRSTVHVRQASVPTRGYVRHYRSPSTYRRGPYTYRPGHPRTKRRASAHRTYRRRNMRSDIVSYARENPVMAYENPLSGGEMIVIAITGVLGYGLGSFLDRLLATHAITDTSTKSSGGIEIYTDAPVSGQLYNTEAVMAPMGLSRWALGLGAPLVLGFGSRFVGGPWLKTVLQGAAVGWGVRTLGMGWDNAMASLFKGSSLGQRYYAQELMAKNAAAAVVALGTGTLPSQSTQAELGFVAGVPRMLAGSCAGCGTSCGGSCGCGGCSQGCSCANGAPNNPWSPPGVVAVPGGGLTPTQSVVSYVQPNGALVSTPSGTVVVPATPAPVVGAFSGVRGGGVMGVRGNRFMRLAGVPRRSSPRAMNGSMQE